MEDPIAVAIQKIAEKINSSDLETVKDIDMIRAFAELLNAYALNNAVIRDRRLNPTDILNRYRD